MIPVSSVFKDAVHYSHSVSTRIDLYKAGALVRQGIPVVSGQVTVDRGASIRMSCDLTVAVNSWEDLPVDVYSHRFRVYRGLRSIGRSEMLMLGEYRVDDVSRNPNGQLSIKGNGLESYVIDARFIRPRTVQRRTNALAALKQLLIESVPHLRFRSEITKNVLTPVKMVWEKDRRDACDQLASSMIGEIFAGYDGVFTLRNAPSLSTGRPVYTIAPGDGGLLTSQDVGNSRTAVYNAAVVTGKDPGNGKPVPFGFASDNNANSPTYWGGEFGQAPLFYTSQFLLTNAQCVSVAKSLLATGMARNRRLTFGATPVPFLEPGDVITVKLTNGTKENHLIQKMTIALGTGGMTIDTLATKIDVGVG